MDFRRKKKFKAGGLKLGRSGEWNYFFRPNVLAVFFLALVTK